MRHRVAHRKLGRVSEHRLAMLRNQAHALLQYERIETTVPKAKELRPFVERIITIAKRGLAGGADNGRTLTARRLVLRDIPDRDVVAKLFETIAPRYAERPGGYTRLLRVGYRRGDSAEIAQVELVGSEYRPEAEREEKAEETPKKKAGVRGRIREAARKLRGKETGEAAGSDAEKPARSGRAGKKPAGGSRRRKSGGKGRRGA
jgi:large subunit ribosomal protein L17